MLDIFLNNNKESCRGLYESRVCKNAKCFEFHVDPSSEIAFLPCDELGLEFTKGKFKVNFYNGWAYYLFSKRHVITNNMTLDRIKKDCGRGCPYCRILCQRPNTSYNWECVREECKECLSRIWTTSTPGGASTDVTVFNSGFEITHQISFKGEYRGCRENTYQ